MSQPIYRYHASQSDGRRFHYSTSPNVGDGWIYDGVAFNAPVDNPNAVPVHQFHYDQSNTYGGWRFNYSTSMKPAQQDWTYDGVKFHAFENQVDQTVPVYRYYLKQSDGARFLFNTGSNDQKDGWTKNGIAFYAYPGELK